MNTKEFWSYNKEINTWSFHGFSNEILQALEYNSDMLIVVNGSGSYTNRTYLDLEDILKQERFHEGTYSLKIV